MEAEVTAQSPDNVSDYFNAIVAPAGDFGSEGEFREFISNAENAKSYFDNVVKERGDFGSDQEFNSFLGLSGSSPAPVPSQTSKPQPTPQQPVKYVPDSKRKLQKEEIVGLVKTFLPGGELSNTAEIIGNKLAGKTEAEIVKMYPALGKQLATRMQNVQSGQKTSGSQSESSTSVLPSLIDQAKKREAFSNYERDQRSYADADKNYQAAFDPNMQPWEKSPDIKANQSAVLSSRNTANVSRQEADDKLKPEIRNDIDESFLTINNDGFRIPNVPKINDYAKGMAAKNGLPEDGYFKEYVYNQAMSEASFKAFEPIIDKYFKPESEKILAEYKNKFEKDFTTDEAEQAKLDLQVKELKDRLEAENKAVIDELQPQLKVKIEEVDNQWRVYEAQTNQRIELLNNQYKTQAIPREVYESEFNKIKEEFQQAYDAYGQERNDVFDGFLVAQNDINSKYNARLKRQGKELELAANGRVRDAQKKYESEIGPEKLARLNRAYSEAVKKAQIEYEGEVKKRFGEKAYNPLVSPISSYIMDKLSVFGKSMTVALGGSLKGLGTTMDIDALQVLGDEAALAYTLPQAKSEEFSDLFDARNFAQLSGQLVGSMAPSLAASAVAGFLTRNAGLVTKLAATGFASWLSESSDMAGRMWDDTFKETGSVAEANSKSQQMWNAQVKMMPLYAFDGLPFIKSGIGRLPFGARVGLGAGIEVFTETLQEIPQNIAEQNIKANKDAFDNLIGLAGDQWKQTVITVAPVAILGGSGQINKTLSPEEKMIEAGRSFGAKARFSEIASFGKRDWVANTVLATSEGFTTTAINTMFSSGIIDQATRDEMIQLTDEAVQNISDAKGLGMNNGDAMVYNAIANNRNKINRQMLQAKEAGNESLVIALKEQLSTADATVREFAATRKGDFGVITFSDGSSVILNDIRSQESLARIAELLKDKGVNGVRFYSKDGKDLMAQVEAMKAQPETTLEQQAQEPENQFEAGSQVDLSSAVSAPTIDVITTEQAPATETQTQTQSQQAPTQANPLADVESTAKALRDIQLTDSFTDFVRNELPSFNQDRSIVSNQDLSEAYHKAKSDGSNPELVQAVEELLTPQQDATQTGNQQQNDQQQREGTAGSQQGQQENRNNQEGAVPQGENQTGGSDSTQQGGAQQETQEVTQTFEERKAAAKEAIRKAKEKRRQSLNNMGIMAPDPEQRAYMDIDVVKAYIDLAKVMIEEGIKNFKDFVAELGEEPSAEIRYAWDVANGDATLDQGLTTTGDGGAGGGTTGAGGTQPDGGNKTGKVRAMIQRVADRMRQKGIPEDQIQKVLEAGTYQPMSMAQMDKAAEALIEEYGLDAALDILRSDQSFNYEIIKALYNRKLGELKNIADTEGATVEQAVEIAKTISDMAAASTSEARSLGFNRFVYINNPDLFYKEKMKEDVESANNEKVKGKGRSNTIRTLAVKARKIRTDAISLLSEVMGGRITAEQLFDPNSKFYLSDNKMRESLKVLLTFGESLNPDTRNILQQMFRDIKGMDKWAREENMDKARDLIKANLKDINGRLPVPLDEASLDQLAKNFTAMWKGMVDSYIIANTKDKKVNVMKVGKDAFSSLAGALGGFIPFESLTNPESRNYISDSKLLDIVKNAIARGYGERLNASLKRIFENKDFDADIDSVEKLIEDELNDYNRSVPVPLPESELAELKKSLLWTFKEKAYGYIIANSKEAKPFTSQRDILNQLANVIAGKTDAVVLFATAKNSTINGSERLAKRMEFLMKKLVKQNASEDGGASWKELVKALNLGGIFNALDNQKEVSEAIKNSLRKLNPTLQTPLDTAEIQELADSIVDIYSEIAEGKIKAMLENQLPKPRTFLGRERISRAAKAVIFGALDFGNTAEERATLSKFSVLFGGVDPNQFTDAQKAKLNQLAGNYVKAAPGFQKQIAMQRFNNALQQAIAYQKKWTTLTYHLGRGGFAFENYIYNNLLFAYGTFMKAFRGNIERILEKYITLGLLGETDVIRFNNRRKLPNVELDIDGQKVSVSVNLNEVLDAMYSAVRGLPKLAEAKSTGLNRAELEIRDTKSLAGRRFKRFFTIPAGRTLMTLDAMTTTSSVMTTKRQVLMQAIIDAYATYGVTKPRAEIQAIVDDILVPTDTAYENALAQAAQDVMNSQLYKDLGMTPADFPILDPRFSKEALGDKAKVYNEWLMRAREILDEQESQRASTSAVNDGWMPMSGTVESMMSQIDSYAAKVTNEMTYLGTPRGSMGVLATEISRISNSAPALKYIGITPMFVNATFNALNNMIRITPGLNAIQFAKYKATGARGAYSTAGKREYDFESIVNVDKKNMIPTLVMTNLGLVAMLGVLSALRGDDEYEREKIIKGKGTFITPMKMPPWLSAIRNEKGEQVYRPGKIYYNGREVSDYKDGAYSFFWGAVATIDNNRLGFKNNPYADAPFKDEESGATDALYAYVTGVMATASEQSMMREQFKMVNDIMDMMYETPGGEYSAGDKLKKLVQRKGGSLVKMLVPYGRMLGDISQVMRDGDDEAMAKQARDFYEYAAQGTAYEEWVLKSNKVDWFGNPVKAEFFRVSSSPFPGFFDTDKGEASREIQMHLSHNYIPVLPPSTRIFVTITKDDLGGEEYLDAYYNSMKAMIDRGEESRVSVDRAFDKYEGGKPLYKGVVSTIELTAEEQSVYNEQRAKFVGAIVGHGSNMSAFEKMDNEGYRAAMDRLYTIGRNYAQLKAVPDLIEKDREDILKAFASQISKFQSDFGSMGVKMPGIGVEINEDFLKQFEK